MGVARRCAGRRAGAGGRPTFRQAPHCLRHPKVTLRATLGYGGWYPAPWRWPRRLPEARRRAGCEETCHGPWGRQCAWPCCMATAAGGGRARVGRIRRAALHPAPHSEDSKFSETLGSGGQGTAPIGSIPIAGFRSLNPAYADSTEDAGCASLIRPTPSARPRGGRGPRWPDAALAPHPAPHLVPEAAAHGSARPALRSPRLALSPQSSVLFTVRGDRGHCAPPTLRRLRCPWRRATPLAAR